MSSSSLSICEIQRDLTKGSGARLPHPNTSHTLGETREDDVGHLGGRRGSVKRRLETHEEGEDNARVLPKKEGEPYRWPYQSGEEGVVLPNAGDEYLET